MTLHFAYGSNMSRLHMRARCPDASAIGTMTLSGWRFVIGPDGFASLVRRPGSCVHGVLWRLSTRDVAAINAYENVQSGLYLRRTLLVRQNPPLTALVYIARRQGAGAPRPGYIDQVVEAARDWKLPQSYIRSIARWAPSRWRGARARDTGEVG
jgi:Gamma-glutamyl cyclotransferase, AIG2-like